ncbi:hypothetical protein [Rhodoferax sp.]|uniref:hypothetical protein n=1 Tax=Rhodoferax sp. TaxID=50421 RepID=UPI002722FA58|nr:hypothetical protein [Rhodoferax sp.]MDO9196481.1 hypothetical protein [Rhodoferax sp.]
MQSKLWLARESPHWRWRCTDPPSPYDPKMIPTNFGNCQLFETQGEKNAYRND